MGKKQRIALILAGIVLVCAVVLIIYSVKISPMIQSLAEASTSNKASAVINDAIEMQLELGEIAYDRIVFLEQNVNGNITAIRTNIAEINRLKVQILHVVDQYLLDLDVSEIGVPLGSLILPEVFSGRGPKIPVRIVSVSTSDADFRNVFIEAGINQTAHQIMLDVDVTMSVLTPSGTQSVQVVSSVLVAETVIVGTVPNSYVDWN